MAIEQVLGDVAKSNQSPREESISLAVGVISTTAMDVYNFLRQRLL